MGSCLIVPYNIIERSAQLPWYVANCIQNQDTGLFYTCDVSQKLWLAAIFENSCHFVVSEMFNGPIAKNHFRATSNCVSCLYH